MLSAPRRINWVGVFFRKVLFLSWVINARSKVFAPVNNGANLSATTPPPPQKKKKRKDFAPLSMSGLMFRNNRHITRSDWLKHCFYPIREKKIEICCWRVPWLLFNKSNKALFFSQVTQHLMLDRDFDCFPNIPSVSNREYKQHGKTCARQNAFCLDQCLTEWLNDYHLCTDV